MDMQRSKKQFKKAQSGNVMGIFFALKHDRCRHYEGIFISKDDQTFLNYSWASV